MDNRRGNTGQWGSWVDNIDSNLSSVQRSARNGTSSLSLLTTIQLSHYHPQGTSQSIWTPSAAMIVDDGAVLTFFLVNIHLITYWPTVNSCNNFGTCRWTWIRKWNDPRTLRPQQLSEGSQGVFVVQRWIKCLQQSTTIYRPQHRGFACLTV